MTGTEWLIVAGLLIGGLLIGLITSRLVYRVFATEGRPVLLREAAGPISTLTLWSGVITGMIGALGVISPESLDQLPRDVVAFLPRVLSATIIVILANVLSAFAMAALGPALSRTAPATQRQVALGVRIIIVGLAGLLAVAQLGIETTVLNLGVAAVFFALAGSFALLVGLGGKDTAAEVAAGRALRRLIMVGDHLHFEASPGSVVEGTVVALYPTTVELETAQGSRVLVPSSQVNRTRITIQRGEPPHDASI